jgi:transcriptional regulator with XRE-family HTH domain
MGFRENLKSEMEYVDISVKELAFLSKVNLKTLESYLSPRSVMPSVESAYKIAKAMNVSVEYLVTGSEGCENHLVAALPAEIRETVRIMERLPVRDRRLALALVTALKNR